MQLKSRVKLSHKATEAVEISYSLIRINTSDIGFFCVCICQIDNDKTSVFCFK